ncbi:DUF6585 family protein [Actinomadura rupiterrae]|uniref:DUF6585 family protein n=1 Tax=Actinomadura rupiterrae TaxID=559627 RepID=UPI0020A5B619|nr:DUF6585 family protein [Actinomadura rupiterrae]MCP2340611.1 hypothetical protein [Actinomadura rupiterrae]
MTEQGAAGMTGQGQPQGQPQGQGQSAAGTTEQQIGAVAASNGLGAHRAAFASIADAQARHANRVGIGAIVLLVLCLVCLATGYPALLIILGGPFLIAVFAYFRYSGMAGRNDGARLDLFERGLTSAYRGQVRAVRYESTGVLQDIVRYTRYGQTTRITYRYTLTDTTGQQLTLSGGYANPEQWGPAIQQAVTDVHLPQAVARVRAGERVEFGPLWLTAAEVGSGSKSVAWNQVEEIKVSNGFVSLRVTGKWSSLSTTSVSRISNFFVFLAVADYLRTNSQ